METIVFSFCFSNKEKEYIDDVVSLVQEEFQLGHPRIYLRNKAQSVEITFYSKIHAEWFARACYTGSVRRAFSKRIPDFYFKQNLLCRRNVCEVGIEAIRGIHRLRLS